MDGRGVWHAGSDVAADLAHKLLNAGFAKRDALYLGTAFVVERSTRRRPSAAFLVRSFCFRSTALTIYTCRVSGCLALSSVLPCVLCNACIFAVRPLRMCTGRAGTDGRGGRRRLHHHRGRPRLRGRGGQRCRPRPRRLGRRRYKADVGNPRCALLLRGTSISSCETCLQRSWTLLDVSLVGCVPLCASSCTCGGALRSFMCGAYCSCGRDRRRPTYLQRGPAGGRKRKVRHVRT